MPERLIAEHDKSSRHSSPTISALPSMFPVSLCCSQETSWQIHQIHGTYSTSMELDCPEFFRTDFYLDCSRFAAPIA
jgi:hypothetical protein